MIGKYEGEASLKQGDESELNHIDRTRSNILAKREQNQLDLRVLHGDGTNTVAKKGGNGERR